MKLFIMTDLEGATGVAGTWEDLNPGGRIHEEAQRFLTNDVNAAIEGALSAGASELKVLDGHGAAFSILLEDVNPAATLIRGRRISEMEGLDGSFQGVLAIGAHSMMGTDHGLLCHTLSSTSIEAVWINDRQVGEIGLWAAISAHFGIPIILVSGDHAACQEARGLLGDIEIVPVKRATSMYAAECYNPTKTEAEIRAATERAVRRLAAGEFRPLYLKTPIVLTVRYFTPSHAESVAQRSGVRRVDSRTVDHEGITIMECMAMLF